MLYPYKKFREYSYMWVGAMSNNFCKTIFLNYSTINNCKLIDNYSIINNYKLIANYSTIIQLFIKDIIYYRIFD